MSRHDGGLLSPSKGSMLPRVSSAPMLTSVDVLPCDDDRLEAADQFSRATLHTSASAHVIGRSGTGSSPQGLSRQGTTYSYASTGVTRPASGWSSSTFDANKSSARPGSGLSSTIPESTGSKALSGRFSKDEAKCFYRLHYPSPQCPNKAEVYFQTTGGIKRALVDENWHTLPTSKGKFFSNTLLVDASLNLTTSTRRSVSPIREYLLPDEALTAKVLNQIFPRTPRKQDDRRVSLCEEDFFTSPGSSSPLRTSPSPSGASVTERLRAESSWPSLAGSEDLQQESKKTPKQTRFKSMLASLDGATSTPPSSTPQEPRTPQGRKPILVANENKKGEKEGVGLGSGLGLPLTPLIAMIDFRKLLISRYHSMDEAIRLLRGELGEYASMSKKDLRCSLQKHNLRLSKEERDAVFAHLDVNGDGHVPALEFDLAIQAASPVKTLADLRRRWLAAGIPSLAHAMRAMQDMGGAAIGTRLSLREFGEKMYHLHVMEHEEHLDLFNILMDPCDSRSRVAMSELIAGLATVSPPMLLEDLQSQLHKKHYGNFKKVFAELDTERQGWVTRRQFVDRAMAIGHPFVGGFSDGLSSSEFGTVKEKKERAMARFGLMELEAEKLYREIDVDDSGRVTKTEFLSALALSKSSLFLEDLRRKVLQRFRSIQVAFSKAFEDVRETDKPPTLPLEKFQEILLPVELSEEDTAKLFSLIDIDGKGALTVAQFVKGILQFAPSWAIGDLRLQCVSRQNVPARAFDAVDVSRTAPLDFTVFSELLSGLDIATGLNLPAIFDMLDVTHTGYVTLGHLIAALQTGGLGSTMKLSEDECHSWAERDARGCILSAHKIVLDLKKQMHSGTDEEADKPLEPEVQTSPSKGGSLRKQVAGKMMSLLGRGAGKRSASPVEGSDGARSVSPGSSPSKAKDGGGLAGSKGKDPLGSTGKFGKVKKYVSAGHRVPFIRADDDNEEADETAPSSKAGRGASKAGGVVPSKRAPRLRTLPRDDVKEYMNYQVTSPEAGPPKPPYNPLDPIIKPSQNMLNDNQNSWSKFLAFSSQASGHKDRQGLQKDIHSYFETATDSLSHDVPLLEKAHSRYAVHLEGKRHASAMTKQKKVSKAEGSEPGSQRLSPSRASSSMNIEM